MFTPAISAPREQQITHAQSRVKEVCSVAPPSAQGPPRGVNLAPTSAPAISALYEQQPTNAQSHFDEACYVAPHSAQGLPRGVNLTPTSLPRRRLPEQPHHTTLPRNANNESLPPQANDEQVSREITPHGDSDHLPDRQDAKSGGSQTPSLRRSSRKTGLSCFTCQRLNTPRDHAKPSCPTCVNQKTGLTCCYPNDETIEQRRYWQQRYGLACKACLDQNGVRDRGSPCNCCKSLNYYPTLARQIMHTNTLDRTTTHLYHLVSRVTARDGPSGHSTEPHRSARNEKRDEQLPFEPVEQPVPHSQPLEKRARCTGHFTGANLSEFVIDTQPDGEYPANNYLASDEEYLANNKSSLSVRQKPQETQRTSKPVSRGDAHSDEDMMPCPANHFLPDGVVCSTRFRAPTSTHLLLEIKKHTGAAHPLTQAARPKNSCPCWELLKPHQARTYSTTSVNSVCNLAVQHSSSS
jgi:hypothetical protein